MSIGHQVNNLFGTTAKKEQEQKKASLNAEIKSNIEHSSTSTIVDTPNSQTVKSTVTLRNNQLVWLDQFSVNIRSSKGIVVDRGALIRSILDAIMQSGIDLSTVDSEMELTKLLLRRLLEV